MSRKKSRRKDSKKRKVKFDLSRPRRKTRKLSKASRTALKGWRSRLAGKVKPKKKVRAPRAGRAEPIRKIKPYVRVHRRPVPVPLRVKKPPRKRQPRKPPRIKTKRKGDSFFADVRKQHLQRLIKYLKDKTAEGKIVRFIIDVKKSPRYPRGLMSTGWYNLSGYSDERLTQFLGRFGRIREIVTAGQ